MERLACIDWRDYDPELPHAVRNAVRAVIVRGGLVVMVRSKRFGEYKFPGGGMKEGETHLDTLVREVREETGLTVIPSSVKEFGSVREMRRDLFADRIFINDSFYYICDTEDEIRETRLDPYEREFGYEMLVTSPSVAIKRNLSLRSKSAPTWLMREVTVLRELERRFPETRGAE